MSGQAVGDMAGAETAPPIASTGEAGHAGPPQAPSDYIPESNAHGNNLEGQPQTFLLYDDGDLSEPAEEELSDMEMWHHNKFGNDGRQDLQELE